MRYAHPIIGGEAAIGKPENFPRPEIKLESTMEDWDEFSATWEQYKAEYNLVGSGLIRQLVAACSEELRRSLSKQTGGKMYSLTETSLFDHIKHLAVGYHNPGGTDSLYTVSPKLRRNKQHEVGELISDGWRRFEIKKDGEVKLRFTKKEFKEHKVRWKFRCEEIECQVIMK